MWYTITRVRFLMIFFSRCPEMLTKKNVIRLLVYLLGIVFLSFGGVLAINSRLGVSPVNLIQLSVSHSFQLDLMVGSIVTFTAFVLWQIVILKRDFKLIQFFQILFAVLFGYLLGFFNDQIQLENLSIVVRVLLQAASLILIPIGIVLTVSPGLVPLAPDGIAGAIAIKMKSDFGKGKIVFDIIIVATSIVLLFITSNSFSDIGIGTIISMLVVGRVVLFINKHFKEKLEKIFF